MSAQGSAGGAKAAGAPASPLHPTAWVHPEGTTRSQVNAVGSPYLCGESKKVYLIETKGQCVVARSGGGGGGETDRCRSGDTPRFQVDKSRGLVYSRVTVVNSRVSCACKWLSEEAGNALTTHATPRHPCEPTGVLANLTVESQHTRGSRCHIVHLKLNMMLDTNSHSAELGRAIYLPPS